MAEAKDRNSVSVEEYRQLSNELLRVQIEIVKAEAQLAGLQNDQPAAAAEDRPFTEKDIARIFYADKRVVATKERYDRAKERFHERPRRRSATSPTRRIQKPLKDMEAAKAELDDLWRELKPEIEAMVQPGRGPAGAVPDNGLKAAEVQLAALKAQEASLTDRLNTLQHQAAGRRRRGRGAGVRPARPEPRRAVPRHDQPEPGRPEVPAQEPDPADQEGIPGQAVDAGDEQPAQDHGRRAGRRCSSACSA